MKDSFPLISVVIPTRANNQKLLANIFSCLGRQTFKNIEVILVCDRTFTDEERKEFQYFCWTFPLKINIISHKTTSFTPHSKGWASYVRNVWIDNAIWEYIQLLDDDNEIDADYLEKTIKHYQRFKNHYKKEVIITPTLLRRNTDKIQNQGFSWYQYWQARPIVHFLKTGQEYAEIKMFSGNWIFWSAKILQSIHYDEKIAWISEDLDFVYSIRETWVPILVFKDLKVHHQERDKTFLEEAWIGNKASAKQKIKNIFIRGKKHANIREKTILLLRSSWWICVRLSTKSLLYWNEKKWEIIKWIRSGYFEGWKLFFH